MARPTPTRRPGPEPGRIFILRSIIVIAVTLFLLISSCGWNIGEHISNWRFALGLGGEGQTTAEEIQQSDAALRWDPDNAQILQTQIALYQQQGDLEMALAKAQQLIDATPTFSEEHFTALKLHTDLLQILGRHEEAITEADAMVALARQASPLLASGGSDGSLLHTMLNIRAYTVARAAAAGKATDAQLGEAQKDMLGVLHGQHSAGIGRTGGDLAAKMLHWERELMYLDTLAYLRLSARNPEALRDLNRCVEQCEYLFQLWLSVAADRIEYATLANMGQRLQQHYAVILHHRGEALAKAGNREEAQRDKHLAKQFGYDPKLGNW